jgi:hypothetical protein
MPSVIFCGVYGACGVVTGSCSATGDIVPW